MKCKHDSWSTGFDRHLFDGTATTARTSIDNDCGCRYASVMRRHCLDCGERLSLGPANDEPAEVRLEIRAAELAAMGAGKFCSNDAWSGWDAHLRGWEPVPTTDAQAGYLARQIATHGEDA